MPLEVFRLGYLLCVFVLSADVSTVEALPSRVQQPFVGGGINMGVWYPGWFGLMGVPLGMS
jgi:hypothetical protein